MTRRERRRRACRDGRPDLQRGRQPGLDRRPAPRGAARRRRARGRRQLARRHRRARRRARRGRRRRSRCCTGPRRAAWARRTCTASGSRSSAGYDVIGEMDADGSHQPEQLHRLLDALRDADLVIGSRWVPGRQRRELAARGASCSRAAATSTSGCCSASGSATPPPATGCSGARRSRRSTSPRCECTGYVFQTDLVVPHACGAGCGCARCRSSSSSGCAATPR